MIALEYMEMSLTIETSHKTRYKRDISLIIETFYEIQYNRIRLYTCVHTNPYKHTNFLPL